MSDNMENYEHIDLPKYEGEFKKRENKDLESI
jgi:hypothetical protein